MTFAVCEPDKKGWEAPAFALPTQLTPPQESKNELAGRDLRA